MRRMIAAVLMLAAVAASAETLSLEDGFSKIRAAVAASRKSTVVLAAAPVVDQKVERSYRKDSVLPPELRRMIIETVERRCPKAQGLEESSSVEQAPKAGQARDEKFFVTEFTTRWYFDGMHPVGANITVRSAQLANEFEVIAVTGEGELCQ